jgi:hypothetical protein
MRINFFLNTHDEKNSRSDYRLRRICSAREICEKMSSWRWEGKVLPSDGHVEDGEEEDEAPERDAVVVKEYAELERTEIKMFVII